MLDPGTALAIAGLVLDVVKDCYEYYSVWKDSDSDVQEMRRALKWLSNLFETVRTTLRKHDDLSKDHVDMICTSIESCLLLKARLEKKLNKIKSEVPPDTLLKKVEGQGRRLLYPFRKSTLVRLLELVDGFNQEMQNVIALLSL